MINLVPSWADHYNEFWVALRKRNLWFIKLRFGAALMLAAFIISAEVFLGFSLTGLQETAILIITCSIVLYNFILIYLRRFVRFAADQFNPLHLSLIQVALDLISLILLCYYTGGIESPLFMLFVFHMIVGSLILPGTVIYSIASATILVFAGIVYLEFLSILPHHSVKGLLPFPLFNSLSFISAFLTVFAFVTIMTVVITNRIARELYKMEQQLIESLSKLKTAEVEKQKYIMAVVHEIKTPLTAVHSYLDLILQKYLGPLNDKVEQKLIRSRTRSLEAISMIDDILKISRIKLLDELNLENIDPKEIICRIAEKQIVNAQNKNIRLKINDMRSEKHLIQGDSFLVEIGLSNIIGNAVKYTPENGRIEIDLTEDKNEVKIAVNDSGIGIPDSDLEKIFQDFYRASNIRNLEFNGTGLGLTVVKQIVQKHKGSIEVFSPSKIGNELNPGSSFVLRLPIAHLHENLNPSALS